MITFATITTILCEIMDLAPEEISPQTYLIRTLKAESIDLLEIGVAMQHRLGIAVDDDILFLKNIRVLLARAGDNDPLPLLAAAYPHLRRERLLTILDDLPAGPVLIVADLAAYAEHAQAQA